MTPSPEVLRGAGVSAGTGVGPVVQVRPPVWPPPDEHPPKDPEAEGRRIRAVFEAVARAFEVRAAFVDEAAQRILAAAALIARDNSLHRAIARLLHAGIGPATAVATAVEEYATQFEALGGYFAERVSDLKDVRDRAIARLLGAEEPGIPPLEEPSVVVARDLAPAEAATLNPDLVRAIVTEHGGPTSHTAILVAQLGIPAVVQVPGVTRIPTGTLVAVDADTGTVTLFPSLRYQQELLDRSERRRRAVASSSGPGRTRDGRPVALLANVGTIEDAHAAAGLDVEGVGLFRTECVFLDRETAPSLEEQAAIYTGVFRAFGRRRVVVRTLDAGADKRLAFADLGPEENPALGRRGLRLAASHPDLLLVQLQALAAAAAVTDASVAVMAPMVATAQEAEWFAAQVRASGLQSAGVMIEVPAAALRARQVLAEVDFGSLGTNDLGQYTMAADRVEGGLGDLLDPWQPAVLQVIATACEGAELAGKPIGACGEAAGDPLLALVLVGLGVSSLSMAPSKVAMIRYALSLHDLADCSDVASAALDAPSALEARQRVRDRVDNRLRDLL